MENNVYNKLINIITGEEFVIQEVPVVFGSFGKNDFLATKIATFDDAQKFIGKTISINNNDLQDYLKIPENKDKIDTDLFKNIEKINTKMIIETCKNIYPFHFFIYKDSPEEENKNYKIYSMAQIFINGKEKPFTNGENGFLTQDNVAEIKSFDTISFNCKNCECEHIFIFYFPENVSNKNYIPSIKMKNITFGSKSEMKKLSKLNVSNFLIDSDENKNLSKTVFANDNLSPEKIKKKEKYNIFPIKTHFSNPLNTPPYPSDTELPKKWSITQKECLKKNVLLYGYDRWELVREKSGDTLKGKSTIELKVFTNSFIRCIVKNIPDEKDSNKYFLLNLITEKDNEPWVSPNMDDWGPLIKQSASAWGKRFHLLYIIKNVVENFRQKKKENKLLRNNINNKEESDKVIDTKYDKWDNLLYFLPDSIYQGQKPANWWTKLNDIDIIRGTYKYGYANYGLIQKDKKYNLYKMENKGGIEMPKADAITRRLKKIVQAIVKCENNSVNIKYEKQFGAIDDE